VVKPTRRLILFERLSEKTALEFSQRLDYALRIWDHNLADDP